MKEHQKQIIESYIQAYNHFDIDGMVLYLDENIVFENSSNGIVNLRTDGLHEFKTQALSAKQYFKQRKQTITSWEFNGTIVIITIDYKATLAVDLPNGLKSGDTFELKGQSEFEFSDGKITRISDRS